MMEDFIIVAVGVYKQTVARVLLDLIQHPNKWSDSCPKCDDYVVLFELVGSYFSW